MVSGGGTTFGEEMQLRTALAASFIAIIPATASAAPIWIKNRYKVDQYLNTQPGKVVTSDVEDSWKSGQWTIEEMGGGFIRIKNGKNGCYVHVERGKVECTAIKAGWHSAQWKYQQNGEGFYYVINRWKGCGLNIERGPVACTAIEAGWHSAQWTVEE
jgi:hypothetical protein